MLPWYAGHGTAQNVWPQAAGQVVCPMPRSRVQLTQLFSQQCIPMCWLHWLAVAGVGIRCAYVELWYHSGCTGIHSCKLMRVHRGIAGASMHVPKLPLMQAWIKTYPLQSQMCASTMPVPVRCRCLLLLVSFHAYQQAAAARSHNADRRPTEDHQLHFMGNSSPALADGACTQAVSMVAMRRLRDALSVAP